MDEAHIAAKVAQNIPVELPSQQAQTATASPAVETDEGYIFTSPLDELSTYKLYDFFNLPTVDRSLPETNRMMNKIIEWATLSGAAEYYDIVGKLREVQQVFKLTDIKSIYRFCKIDMQSKRLDAEMRALYG